MAEIALPAHEACRHCKGQGLAWEKACPECDGKGEFLHRTHWYECKGCTGGAVVSCPPTASGAKAVPCESCQGSGEAFQSVVVARALFQRRYLAMLADLPNCSLQPDGADGAAKFTFDGGYGFLMPCRQ